jgi:hypothetical protein
MPTLLLSPIFWKVAGAVLLICALAIATGTFVHHYEYLKQQAALVGPLQDANKSLVKQAARDDARAANAAIKLVATEAARDQAVADQNRFHDVAGQIGTTLQGISHNANATKNPVCLPSDGERVMFNAAVARFFSADAGSGSGGALGQLPQGAH